MIEFCTYRTYGSLVTFLAKLGLTKGFGPLYATWDHLDRLLYGFFGHLLVDNSPVIYWLFSKNVQVYHHLFIKLFCKPTGIYQGNPGDLLSSFPMMFIWFYYYYIRKFCPITISGITVALEVPNQDPIVLDIVYTHSKTVLGPWYLQSSSRSKSWKRRGSNVKKANVLPSQEANSSPYHRLTEHVQKEEGVERGDYCTSKYQWGLSPKVRFISSAKYNESKSLNCS